MGQLLQERISSSLEQLLSLKSRPYLFRRAMSSREANRNSCELFPFVQLMESMELYPYTSGDFKTSLKRGMGHLFEQGDLVGLTQYL